MAQIEKLQEIIDESKRIVFFGGAGVSTESGVPDFRSEDGLYHQKYDYPPEVMLSHSFFESHPSEFFKFYKDKMLLDNIEPNAAHIALAKLESAGKLDCVITQNIDGLHQKAGSKKVYELHGSVLRNYCESCGEFYNVGFIKQNSDVPHCTHCGGIIKPDVVLYEEPLNEQTVQNAVNAISNCDTLIVGGTSLVVYPAAGLLRYFRGRHLVLINRDETSADSSAELIIREKIGEVLSKIKIRGTV